MLENKNAVIYGGGGFIGSVVALTFANAITGTFPSLTPASMTTRCHEERQRDD